MPLSAAAQVWLGVGYDGISQDYYLATGDTTGLPPDSLDRLRQTATAINESQVSLRTRVGDGISWDQTTAVTSLYWHHRTALAAYTPRARDLRGGLEYNLNIKAPLSGDETSAFSDYRVHEVRAEAERRFGGLALRLRGTGEFVTYPDPQEFAYDYRQYRAQLRLVSTPDFANYRELSASVVRRVVPDSARVSYLESSALASLSTEIGTWRATASLEGADRRYDVVDAGLDFGVLRLRAMVRDGAYPHRWQTTLEVEGYTYYADNSLLSDFVRAEFEPRWLFPLAAGWSPFIEPGIETVRFAEHENYFEPRLKGGTELFRFDGWWANADVGLGYRDYEADPLSSLSDFWNLSLSLIVDGPLTHRINLSILYSHDWEWHSEAADDISVLLLSAGLKYRL